MFERAFRNDLAVRIGGQQLRELPAGPLIGARIGRDPRLEIGSFPGGIGNGGRGENSRQRPGQNDTLTYWDNWVLLRLPA